LAIIGNRRLRYVFNFINGRFFDGLIPANTVVKFADIEDDGRHTVSKGIHIIQIHKDLKKHPDVAATVLIHEMIHADLKCKGYRGYSANHCHEIMFCARMHELYLAGIYEGLL